MADHPDRIPSPEEDALTRVERGAALLDQHKPNWELQLDPGRLSILDYFNCVLGQLFGTFSAGLDFLWPGGGWAAECWSHGFHVKAVWDSSELAALELAWLQQVEMRRATPDRQCPGCQRLTWVVTPPAPQGLCTNPACNFEA